MASITACIIAYNEEKRIRGCLESLVGVVDDIVVVHDGPCSDATLDIARQFGARVFIGSHYGYMEPHLPQAYREAKGEWVLRIDADEALSLELRKALPQLITDSRVDAYEFLWRLHDGQRYLTRRWPHKRCLFRKDAVSFLALPDYVAQVPGVVSRLDLELIHTPGYDNYSWETFRKKWIGLAKIRREAYLSDIASIPSFNYSSRWPRSMAWRRHRPLLVLPADVAIVFVKTWADGWREGTVAVRAALCQAALRFLVDWSIYRTKKS